MEKPFISFCFGLYNEELIVEQNIKKLVGRLEKIVGSKNFEIIAVNNGSTDGTLTACRKIPEKRLTVINVEKRGLGRALQKSLSKAKGDIIVFSAIDLPFGMGDLTRVLKMYPNFDIVFGSKAHPKSRVRRNLKRSSLSFLYETFLRILFNLEIKDPQGSIFFKKSTAKKIHKFIKSRTAFASTQVAIYSQRMKMNVIEIPVTFQNTREGSKYNFFKDGTGMLYECVREYLHIAFSKTPKR